MLKSVSLTNRPATNGSLLLRLVAVVAVVDGGVCLVAHWLVGEPWSDTAVAGAVLGILVVMISYRQYRR
jgi:hypothetical protein